MRQIGVKNVKLSEYEMSIAAHLVDPLTMQVMPRSPKQDVLYMKAVSITCVCVYVCR